MACRITRVRKILTSRRGTRTWSVGPLCGQDRSRKWQAKGTIIIRTQPGGSPMVQIKQPENRPMTEEGDFLQIQAMDHLHFYVGNAKQAMFWWWKGFGFKPVAYSGLETGNRKFASYVLESGKIRFVVSAPYTPSHEMAGHHLTHGAGVKVIAIQVKDVEQAYKATTARGGQSAWAPREEKDEFGVYRTAAIHIYGEGLHVFVDRSQYSGPFAPGYQPLDREAGATGLAAIGHVVGNVQLGKK